MTRALVTGVNGHIGANLVRVLLDRGIAVRGLVREGSERRGLDGLDVELVTGDLLDAESLRSAAEGCQQMYHAGALYSVGSRDPGAIVRPALARHMGRYDGPIAEGRTDLEPDADWVR